MKDLTIYIGDTETSGLTNNDALVEIGWLEVSSDLTVLNSFETLVDPECAIHPLASATHHLVAADLVDAPTTEEIFTDILAGVVFKPAILVAHNVQFDIRFWPKQKNIQQTLCTLKAARKLYPNAPNHQMQTLRYYLELEVDNMDLDIQAHRALSDVVVLFSLLKRMLKDTGLGFWEFYSFVAGPAHVHLMPFGKYKGMELAKVPKDYVEYILKNFDNIDNDLRVSLGAL